MDSLSWLQILAYISFAVLVIGIAARAIKYFTMPIHLRWELYPVPHEKKEGSYFEEIDWWKKPRKKHYLNHIMFVIQEILFIRALYHHNRKLWNFSFPFHFGLYLVIGWLALLILSAILNTFGPGANLAEIAHRLAVFIGVFGFILGIIGCIGLIIKRATAEELKGYTAPVDYFNLIFILMVFVSGIVAWFTSDPRFLSVRAFIEGLITFKPVEVSASVALHITIFSLFLIYLPFTHMTHFVMKYFMWDKVRFEDEPNLRGSAVESKVAKVLNYTQNWSAPHIQTGKKWSETATKGVE
jgi:nitrate reductase gamma subunit